MMAKSITKTFGSSLTVYCSVSQTTACDPKYGHLNIFELLAFLK